MSLTFNGARLIGLAVAGAVLALVGETACFAANAVSYLAAIGTLLALHPHATEQQRRGGRLREAFDYLKRFAPARWMLINVSAASFCVAPMATFMPVYAKDIFHGGPDTLGMLMGVSGLGAVNPHPARDLPGSEGSHRERPVRKCLEHRLVHGDEGHGERRGERDKLAIVGR